MSEYDLNGIDEISEFSKQRHETVLRWRNFFGLPIKKIGGIWRGNRAEIETWARARGKSIKDLRPHDVNNYFERTRLEAAVEKEEETISGSLSKVAAALGDIPPAIIQGWLKTWGDIPIKMLRKGHYEVSPAAFQLWLMRHPALVERKGAGKNDVEYSF